MFHEEDKSLGNSICKNFTPLLLMITGRLKESGNDCDVGQVAFVSLDESRVVL
jgi:hypothetical protein